MQPGVPPGPHHNLPAALSDFVGRRREVAEATRLLADARLLTLIGVGGIGKTRLALQVAWELLDAFADGVLLVNLAPITDPALVPAAIAQVVGVRETAAGELPELLAERLRDKHLLLVLDNLEQVLQAVGLLALLLSRCPELRILATSRSVIHLTGEHVLPVPPLTMPGPSAQQHWEELLQYEAVSLFVTRAQAAQPGFVLTNENAGIVAEICRRLDGLPLAIELAAVRVRLLSPQALLRRLDDRLTLLAGGASDAPERQQSLRDTIAWSYDLLTPAERSLFRRLAVFVGGCTLEAAAAAGAQGAPRSAHARDVLDGITSLLDKSLLRRDDDPDGEPRFRMLETIHEFAAEELRAAGEDEAVRERHRSWFLALAEEGARGLQGAEQTAWLARLELEQDNLRAALGWSFDRAESEPLLRLAAALWQFWRYYDLSGEGRGWLERALVLADTEYARQARSAPETGLRSRSRAQALVGAGALALKHGDFNSALAHLEAGVAAWRELADPGGLGRALLWLGWARERAGFSLERSVGEESLTLCREAGDHWGIGESLHYLGHLAMAEQRFAEAQACFDQSLALFRMTGNQWSISLPLKDLGIIARREGQLARAGTLYTESLALVREVRDQAHIADTLNRLAELALLQGDDERALACYAESLALQEALGNKRLIAALLHNLGRVALGRRALDTARTRFVEALDLYQATGRQRGIAFCLAGFAAIAAERGRLQRAAQLFGAASEATAAYLAGAVPFDAVEHLVDHEARVVAVCNALGEATFAREWQAGRALSPEAALTLALNEDPQSQNAASPLGSALVSEIRLPERAAAGSDPLPRRGHPDRLTTRELEVLRLLASGKTNREIAAALVLSERTVDSHVARIYGHLGIRRRAQATAYALRHGLIEHEATDNA